jgi:hypothetical protein
MKKKLEQIAKLQLLNFHKFKDKFSSWGNLAKLVFEVFQIVFVSYFSGEIEFEKVERISFSENLGLYVSKLKINVLQFL